MGADQAYIWRIVSSVALDYIRKQRVRQDHARKVKESGVQKANPNPEEILIRNEHTELGFKAIFMMSEECRTFWQLWLVDGLSQSEVAQKFKITKNNLRQKIRTCREKLREIMKKLTGED